MSTMRMAIVLGYLLGAMIFFTSPSARAECANLPGVVIKYLRYKQGWSLVDLKSLAPDDRRLWRRYHSGECPGLAKIDPDGSGLPAYALALLRYDGNEVLEEVVVVGPCACAIAILSEPMNVKSTDAPAISVIWRAHPDRFVDVISGRTINVSHDGVMYEKIGAGTLLYYLRGGYYRTIQTAE